MAFSGLPLDYTLYFNYVFMSDQSDHNFETLAIRNHLERTHHNEHTTPLYLTSSFVFDDAEDMRASFAEEKERNIYSRFTNPNTSEFISKLCAMEEAEDGYAFSTGMAAIFSTFAALLIAVIILFLLDLSLGQRTDYSPNISKMGYKYQLF